MNILCKVAVTLADVDGCPSVNKLNGNRAVRLQVINLFFKNILLCHEVFGVGFDL
jgi:hypothetical protein